MKTCTKCKEGKTLDEFSNDKSRKDGKRGRCKDCENVYSRAYREVNADRVNARSKAWRDANPDRRRENLNRWRSENQEKHNSHVNKYPEKVKARRLVNGMIRGGRLTRPESCSKCLKACNPEAHHWSYLKENWIDVDWLCSQCHKDEHARLNKLK